MAGEWISIDCCIATKPEILELIGETGEPADVIVGRLTLFWAWASLNSGDGSVKGNPGILKAVAGGEEPFWRAVQRCGWITFGDGVIEIHGWEDRFSKAAKARLLTRRRLQKHRENAGNPAENADETVDRFTCNADETQDRFTMKRSTVSGCNAPALLDRGDRGEEIEKKRGEETPAGGPSSSVFDLWEDFRPKWAATAKTAGKGGKQPPKGFAGAVGAGYCNVLKALAEIPKCEYFESPVTMAQFFSPGFIDRILDGHFTGKTRKRGKPPDEERPARAFEGDDAKRFAATLERIRNERRVK